ncbi:hypothetical protein AB0I30_32660 [Nocardia tengchongensis]|uniref:hypothetical protein n=1 Tax=Nocardia tengchongensis TaxID=2055889 RepID=UPI00340AFFF5
MTMHIHPARRIGWGIAGLAASLAAVTTSTPTAAADVQRFWVATAENHYYAGADYQLYAATAQGAGARWVIFSDNGTCIGGALTNTVPGYIPMVGLTWTPTTAGRHVLTADDGQTTKSITADVQPTQAGTTPRTPPTPTGCGKLQQLLTTGSGTGSAAIGLG